MVTRVNRNRQLVVARREGGARMGWTGRTGADARIKDKRERQMTDRLHTEIILNYCHCICHQCCSSVKQIEC